MPKRVRKKTNNCFENDYNLRSKAKRFKSEDKNNALIDSQLSNSQNCEELTQINVSINQTMTQTTHKLTKMPNKYYNLRRRGLTTDSKAAQRRRPLASRLALNDLPDDCLLCIFEKLDTIRDKCRVQSVSKRFYFLVNRLLRAQKTFTVASTFGSNPKNYQILSQSMCNNVIRKCPNLQMFKMPGFYAKDNSNGDNRIGDKEMYALANCCPDLRELDICGCGNVTEMGINYICSECTKLEKMSISFCQSVTGVSFRKLTQNFKTLSLNLNDLTPPLLECLRSISSGNGRYLSELNVCAYNVVQWQENILQMISNNFENLQCLRYSISSKEICKYGVFGNLKNLTHLAFEANTSTLNDEELIKIMSGCTQLKTLFIRYEVLKNQNTITDYSLRKIPVLCPKLEKLHFNAKSGLIDSVTDASINSLVLLKQLEVLSLKSFVNIGDSVINVIKLCPKLNHIILLNCQRVTNATIDALIAAAKSQPNKKIKFNVTGDGLKRRRKRRLPINLIDDSES